ncbi:alpha/beta fold hydrolase [Humidisolicoccus flavus]|uniref:alpha/beta fold hydrolase n=1 Tax=Humidisolicoccus flavus TaxID=3111414 RepID=UPI00324BFF85
MTPARKPLLVLLHGGGVGPWMWAAQRAHFADRFEVVTPTLPGHDPARTSDFTTTAAAARAVAEEIGLEQRGEPVTVLGFSLGGQVAVHLAALFPRQVDRLIVVSSVLTPVPAIRMMAPLAMLSFPLSKQENFARKQAAAMFLSQEMLSDYLKISRALSRASFLAIMRENFSCDAARILGSIEAIDANRVLLISGEKEPKVLQQAMSKVAAQFPAATRVSLPDTSHGSWLQSSSTLHEELDVWLERTGPPAP